MEGKPTGTVYLLCGKTGSGKSTFARTWQAERGAALLSVDELMLALFPEYLGEAHRAVHDAENSASLLTLVKEGRLKEQADAVWAALHPEHSGASLAGTASGDKLQALLERMERGEHQ